MSNLIKMSSGQPVLAFAAATVAAYNSGNISAGYFRGVNVVTEITTPNGATLVVKVQGCNPRTGTYYDLLGCTTASLTTAGVSVLTIYPGIAVTANQAVSMTLPDTIRLVGTVSVDTLILATVDVSFLV